MREKTQVQTPPVERIRHFNEFKNSSASRGTADPGRPAAWNAAFPSARRVDDRRDGFRLSAAQSGAGDQ